MKKFLAVFLTLFLISVTAAACGKETAQEQPAAPETAEVQTEAAFELTLDGVSYPENAAELRASSISEEALEKLPRMTALKQVTVTEGSGENLEELRTYCDEKGIAFQIEAAGQTITDETAELTLPNVTENQVQLLGLMPNLKSLHFPEPEAPAEVLLGLRTKLPETAVTWEKTVLGMTFSHDAVEIDLTPVIALAEGQALGDKTAYDYGLEFRTMGTQEEPRKTAKILPAYPIVSKWEETEQLIAEVEAAMPYFLDAKKVLMCGAMMDDEAMAQFREAHREEYKVVWSVVCGDMAVRTDATFFMPTKYYVEQGAFSDIYAYNLRYCEDMVSIDLGHMNVTELDFVEYMPNLKHLVLTLSPVGDLNPLSTCKNLVYLEMHKCFRIEDYSPLIACTSLKALDIGNSVANIEPILEMTWLENLNLSGWPTDDFNRIKITIPAINITDDVNENWRSLEDYRAMRDSLLMFYMQ